MLERVGRLVYRYRWPVVFVWVLLFAASALVAPRVSGVLRGGGYTIGDSESVIAYNKLHEAYGFRALTFTIAFAASPGAETRAWKDAAAFRRTVSARFGRALAVSAPLWTPDRRVVVERVYSTPQEDFGASFATPLRALLPRGRVAGYLTGPSAIFHDMETVSDGDLQRVEVVTLPIALVVLLLIFGTVVASLTPVLMAPVAVTAALAVIYFLGHRIDMSIFVLNTTSMLGLGVAIDYSLFMVNRFRSELALGREPESAIARTVATSGRAILVSAAVVSVGFIGLALSGVSMLRSLGIGGSIVTVFSLLAALTLLPAVLAILGARINSLPVVPERFQRSHIWHDIALLVMRRPVAVILAVSFAIVVLAAPAFHLRVGIPGPDILPPSVDSRAGNDVLNTHLGLANHSPVLVVIEREPTTAPNTYQSVGFALLDRICASREVAGVSSHPVPSSPRAILSCTRALDSAQNATHRQLAEVGRLASRHRIALVSVFLHSDPSSSAAERYVTQLRSEPRIPGYRVYVGGQTAGQMDFDNYLYSRFPLVVLFVILTIYAVLLVAFRSVLLPLKAILMNVFSVLAAYGAVVFVFQDAHFTRFLGFTSVGSVDSIVPVFLFCVLFGISTDYEVFLLTRVQEEYRRSRENEGSVATGLAVTGRIITSAAAIMILVFGAFAFARLVVIKEVGLGLAVAVLIDATLIRVLLVPATMRLLGEWNWWLPGWAASRRGRPRSAVSTGRTPAAH